MTRHVLEAGRKFLAILGMLTDLEADLPVVHLVHSVTLDAFRDQYRLPHGSVYLDHAATGVLSQAALEAASDFLAGRAGTIDGRMPNNFPADLEVIDRARSRAAALVSADLEGVAVVPNTSYGLNLVAQGLDWQPGDRVSVPGCEFPSNLLPWRALEGVGVEVDLVPHRDGTFYGGRHRGLDPS